MKIIDFEQKGNIVRFYFGTDDCNDYWGDDWDDRPYEHNAGTVYPEYIAGAIDVAFPFDALVLSPERDWRYGGNSPFSKEDFKRRKAPCIVVVKDSNDFMGDSYSTQVGNDKAHKFYFNDTLESISACPYCTVLGILGKEEAIK